MKLAIDVSLSKRDIKQLKNHYENTPIQYTVIFHGCKNDNFQMKICDIFLFML